MVDLKKFISLFLVPLILIPSIGTKDNDFMTIHLMIFCTGGELSCPSDNVNTQSRENAEKTFDVISWSACSEVCRQKPSCQHWTWNKDPTASAYQQCTTMSGYGNTHANDRTMSGDRDCGGTGLQDAIELALCFDYLFILSSLLHNCSQLLFLTTRTPSDDIRGLHLPRPQASPAAWRRARPCRAGPSWATRTTSRCGWSCPRWRRPARCPSWCPAPTPSTTPPASTSTSPPSEQ